MHTRAGVTSAIIGLGTLTSVCGLVVLLSGCSLDTGGEPVNPFTDFAPIALDGEAKDLTSEIVPLGLLETGDVLQVDVTGEGIDAVFILAEDASSDLVGVIAGGGRANEPFQYRIPHTGRYFLFTLFDPQTDVTPRRATIAVAFGDPTFAPPASQRVLIVFLPDYLTDPGLVSDPDADVPEELAVLESIGDTVREGIITRLKTIFEGTPVEILTEEDASPVEPFSTVTFDPKRIQVDDPALRDSAVFGDSSKPECDAQVVYGEVLPTGAFLDPGNQVPDDTAVVYVGSFQGRGETCQSAALNSVNNIILGLSQTAAHEIGHLIGLVHVPLTDIMDRSPSLAFQRELSLQRGQMLTEELTEREDGTLALAPVVLTTVIQDPAFYFEANFGVGSESSSAEN